MKTLTQPLFVLEMANNHMGDLDHGLQVIREFGAVCRNYPEFSFAFKLQYRDLDTFIHPAMQGRDDIKYIKRFSETRLSRAQFDTLVAEMRAQGFLVMATPFDEVSVGQIEDQKLDFLKIPSCSFNDWPLLERVVQTDLPIIASTAGAAVEDMDQVISFLQHRNKDFAILHCVGEYPTPDERMHLSQIDFLRQRYPDVEIGFSTHEDPDHTDLVKIAIAKGARIFEKHVGVATERYALNGYSASPQQVDRWLAAARHALMLCGVGDRRLPPNEGEAASLRSLRRGVFVKRGLKAGHVVGAGDVYFAFPPQDGQITANNWSKYASFTLTADVEADGALTTDNTRRTDVRAKVLEIVGRVKDLLEKSRTIVPGRTDLEISHHYGIENFDETGLTMLTVVNRGYCKKLLVSLPGQKHPEQYHQQKEETFHVLYGEITLTLDGVPRQCKVGDVVNVEPGVRHAFETREGAVIEEISSTHFKNDSFYTDESIQRNPNRKTLLTHWMA
jgi:sialic acid synthase SpsE/mannose-6-phosphate isomerase-like protein (cupin superfamily)